MKSNRRFLLVTGLSGAGKSSALSALEDMGYEAVDNLPLSLVGDLLEKKSKRRPIAIGVDTRTRDFSIEKTVKVASKHGGEIVYLTCDQAELQKRFNATRRRHPLAQDKPAIEGIRKEIALLRKLRSRADYVIDTTTYILGDLKQHLVELFEAGKQDYTTYTVMSFSYAKGVPAQADFVFDVRFLKNPHYVTSLKKHDGRHKKVQEYVAADPAFDVFVSNVQQTLEPLLPLFEKEGKNYVTLAFGCTGGQHRSVFLAETFGKWLKGQKRQVLLRHREQDK